MNATRLFVTEIDTQAGAIVFWSRGERLVALSFKDHWPRLQKELEKRFGALELTPDANGGPAGRALRRYLDGDLGALDVLEIDTDGTPFQEKVWSRLRKIPAGATLSYAPVSYTHLRAHETRHDLVCRLL